ncbi:CHAD domain-containing protein [Hyphomicrobium facile]|uniref:CHAD domain-containing protein n=1 Tax=Hyphomicrobium facile TaxID=51670 RepID=A0A1I7MWH8_9HYPH|nr:CHAD domain-containing protein [Hyphomicrobium facile]SFV26696.1 CHAD domain-containing protein [Hyphomicrobium facile]
MPYRFKINEPVEKGFRRIAREQFDSSIAELSGPTADPKGVHECRKSIKRLRALIRLSAVSVGTKKARRRTKALGEIGRLLSARRDQTVMFETIQKLADEFPEAVAAFVPLKAALTARAGNQPERLDAETADRARGLLDAEAKKIERLDFKHKGFAALAGGLETSYRKARKAIAYAYDEPTDENFHELRKAVQWHWRQMALLARAWPDEFAVRVNASRELSQWLGDDHDLAVLVVAVSAAPDMADEQKEAAIAICRRQQQVLRAKAEFRVKRLFSEKTRAFIKRAAAYWEHGRALDPLVDAPSLVQPVPQAADAARAELNGRADERSDERGGEPDKARAASKPRLATKSVASAPSQRRA